MKMRRIAVRLVVTVLVYAMAIAGTSAQGTRTWQKFHQVIAIDSTPFGEYTFIGTSDGARPTIARFLVTVPSGARAVVRHSLDSGGSGTFSISAVGSPEALTFTVDVSGIVTVSLGTGSFTYHEDDANTSEVRQQGLTLLQTASTQFQSLVIDVARLGRYAPLLHVASNLVTGSIATSVTGSMSDAGEQDPTELIKNFDPAVSGPGPFETPFGSAYYE